MEQIVELDLNQLDTDWVRQPKLYYKFAEMLAHAKAKVDVAKALLEVTVAELDGMIRSNPEKYKLEKVTELMVRNAVTLHKKHKRVTMEYNEARHEMYVLQAAVNTLDHRKAALENLVRLQGQNYFSTPQATTENAQTAKRGLGDKRRRRARDKEGSKK